MSLLLFTKAWFFPLCNENWLS